ncbi:MAG: RNA 2'-phosphotransferase [Thermodesulfobacteriota bacterium]|nr:RNA 2'-phosphotransferase [Thermodesulfobacteriota bacterium]
MGDSPVKTMGKRRTPRQLGKLMHYVLGRRPDEFGLVLDAEGFVPIKEMIKALSEEPGWGYVRRSHVHEVLITVSREDFVVTGDRIRACSRDDAISPVAGVVPPKLLYHALRRKAYPVVCEKGIHPMGQHHVFLATTKEMALRMGSRRDPKPVLLIVQARRASEAGVPFLRQGELLYMVDHVPVGYFSGPPLPKEKKEAPKARKEPLMAPEALAGSFALDMDRSRELQQRRIKRKGLKKDIQWKKDARKLRRKQR